MITRQDSDSLPGVCTEYLSMAETESQVGGGGGWGVDLVFIQADRDINSIEFLLIWFVY